MPIETKIWTIGASRFEVVPKLGCRLMRWSIAVGKGSVREILYWPGDADQLSFDRIRGGNPILFPFVARTFADNQENAWRLPSGEVVSMPRHGFARNGCFEMIGCTDSGFSAKLLPTAEDLKSYPFNYEFIVKYSFGELSLTVDLILKNHDEQRIPWCAGHHFYFTLPWHAGLNRSHYQLHLESKKSFYHDKTGILRSGNKLLKGITFDHPDLIDCIHTKLKTAVCSFGPKSGEENITLTIGEASIPSPWTAITTWTLDDESPFYCVEPWMGPPNAPSHGQGLHWVEPGACEVFKVKISL